MRLCAFADEADPTLTGQIKALCSNGIKLIELRGINGQNISQMSLNEIKEVKRSLDASGIQVWSVASPIGKLKISADLTNQLDAFKRLLLASAMLDARRMRIFSFYVPQNEPEGAYRDAVMERINTLCREAEGYPVTLCHENEKGIYGDTLSRCLDIHRTFPQVKGVFDPANFVCVGEDVMKAWKKLKKYTEYLHIKDALSDGTTTLPGRGQGHIPELLTLYNGDVVTLEPHLKVFDGLSGLEEDTHRVKIEDRYATGALAFSAAANALKKLLYEGGTAF